MNGLHRQSGFSLATAIFLLTVVATLTLVTGRVFLAGSNASTVDILAARAFYAARSAMELAILSIGNSATQSCPTLPASIEGFRISLVVCNETTVDEAGLNYKVFDLEVLAAGGAKSSADLVQRRIRGVVKIDAP